MPRYVILRHETPADVPRASHWDLMLEYDGVLQTWALPNEPQQAQIVRRLDDHRLVYLEFEGPLSGDRGLVKRWDEGTYETLVRDDHAWRIALTGQVLNGEISLAAKLNDPNKFAYEFCADS